MVQLSFHGQFKVILFWVDHGQIDGQFKVMFSGLTMVKLMVISWSFIVSSRSCCSGWTENLLGITLSRLASEDPENP